jgi:putative ABC transport system substrate-binding protein
MDRLITPTHRQSRRRFIRGTFALAGLGLASGCGLQVPPAFPGLAPHKVPRIGYFTPASPDEPFVARLHAWFREDLRELGYVEGQNITIEYRWATGPEEAFAKVAAELVELPVDVIVTTAGQPTRAAQRATQTIPIVRAFSGDVVHTGLVASLGRPEGNTTGFSYLALDLAAKRLQLLVEALPPGTGVASIWNRAEIVNLFELDQTRNAAQALGLTLDSLEIASLDELPSAFATAEERGEGVVVFAHAFSLFNQGRFIELAARHRRPVMYGLKEFAERGGLMAYGPDLHKLYQRVAAYVDKLLKGTKTANLPIEQPNTFDFVVNLKTAQALGLSIPPSVLAQATELIQ